VVGGDVDGEIVFGDPAFAIEKTGNTEAFGDVFLVVPVVELVSVGGREVERHEQQAFGHCSCPPVRGCAQHAPEAAPLPGGRVSGMDIDLVWSADMPFLTEPEPERGALQAILPGINRIVANNPGPMTYLGTNTYLIDAPEGLVVLDPGPEDHPEHVEAIM